MYIVSVLMMSMLTSNNNMRIRHMQFLGFATITTPFIQPDHEISSKLNLSRVYCLLDQKAFVLSIELKNSVSVCISLCDFDDLVTVVFCPFPLHSKCYLNITPHNVVKIIFFHFSLPIILTFTNLHYIPICC